MVVLGGLLTGGLLYSGIRVRQMRAKNRIISLKRKESSALPGRSDAQLAGSEKPGEKDYPVATATLGLALAGRFLYAPLTFAGVAGMLYLLWPTFKNAYHDLVHRRRFTTLVLEALVLPGTILAGQFLAVAVAFWFLYFALNNVAKAKWNANENLANVFIVPSTHRVYVVRDDVEVELAVKDLQVGDILVVGAGEIIPVDGTITQGHATIDQHMLTGESQPVEKQVHDPVFAATLVLDGNIRVRVGKAGKETLASQSVQILNDMTRYTDNLELRGTDAADRMALPMFMLGLATGAFMGVGRGLAIVWTPLDDALYAAGPLSVLNFLNIALRRGILVKDGRALEVLRQVDTIVFDKTGTLTKERPQVVNIHTSGALSENDILRCAAAAEQKQRHPVALAILEAASARNIDYPRVRSLSYKQGYGLTVVMDGQEVSVGSARFMRQRALAIPEALQSVEAESHELGYSLIFVAVDERIVGAIEIHASLRDEAAKTIAQLHAQGYQVCIISGDHEQPTRHLSQRLGVDRYFAETLPGNKAELIRAMQKEGHTVCYVGDGINDTIALKQAEVAVSLRGASTIATDTAQIVLMKEDLSQLLDLIAISRKLDNNFKATVVYSAAPTLAIISGVFFFHMTLATAILLYLTGMGLSVTQAMLPLWEERRSTSKEEIPGRG